MPAKAPEWFPPLLVAALAPDVAKAAEVVGKAQQQWPDFYVQHALITEKTPMDEEKGLKIAKRAGSRLNEVLKVVSPGEVRKAMPMALRGTSFGGADDDDRSETLGSEDSFSSESDDEDEEDDDHSSQLGDVPPAAAAAPKTAPRRPDPEPQQKPTDQGTDEPPAKLQRLVRRSSKPPKPRVVQARTLCSTAMEALVSGRLKDLERLLPELYAQLEAIDLE